MEKSTVVIVLTVACGGLLGCVLEGAGVTNPVIFWAIGAITGMLSVLLAVWVDE